MRTASKLLREAVGYSHTLECVVDFYQNGVLVWEAAPVSAGTLTSDRKDKVRTSCNVTVAIEEWKALPFDNKAGRFKVRRGVGTLGYKEAIQLGEFRVDDITRPSEGRVSITGSGLEAYIEDARFIRPRKPLFGASTVEQIIALVREVMPTAQFKLRNTTDTRIASRVTWERERNSAIDELADSIDAEVFVDGTGSWVIANKPDPEHGTPVFIVNEGSGGVLVSRTEKNTRDRVYNAASVTGTSDDPKAPPLWGFAADLRPYSPTYYYGPFGQKPIFYTSGFFTASWQCYRYANKLLAEALAENVSIDFTTAPIDFLEVSDLLGVATPDGAITPLILESYSANLGVNGGLKCETISSKAIIADPL